MTERSKPGRSQQPESTAERVLDQDVARFFLALGAVGDPERAAGLAGVDPKLGWSWLDQMPRPEWVTRRREAACRMFDTACAALRQTQSVLRGEVDEAGEPTTKVGLRDLVMVAERFFAAALKLDREVGADAEPELCMDLGAWAEAADGVDRPTAASGTVPGAAQ